LSIQDTADFFEEVKPWSETKNELLRCYLRAYFQKVFPARRDVLYVDGFAGAGHFNNGDVGSPIIAMQAANLALQNARRFHPKVQFIMSEHDERRLAALQDAVKGDSLAKRFASSTKYVQEGFGAAIESALALAPNYGTFFFYIDPFGIVDLDFGLFEQIARLNGLGNCGVEVLLNFSSVGFLREACWVYSAQETIPQDAIADNPDEGFSNDPSGRGARLDRIFGGREWRSIVEALKSNKVDYWSAEKMLSEAYQSKLREQFRYVLNMPIKDTTKRPGTDGLLKYRMFHMTNHTKGCNLMNNTMVARFENPAQRLWPIDVTGAVVNSEDVTAAFANAVYSMTPRVKYTMGAVSAYVISKVGVFKRQSQLCKEYLPPLFDSGVLKRVVETTHNGRPKRSFAEDDEIIRLQ
jgi:three-Cys-motif partner protein